MVKNAGIGVIGLLSITIAMASCLSQAQQPDKVTPDMLNGLIAYPFRVSGFQQIFTIRSDGTNKTQLTFEGDNALPSWSPDGSRISYTHDNQAPNNRPSFSIWIMNADGSDQRMLVANGKFADWGPNNQIVYMVRSGNPNRPSTFNVIDLDGGEAVRVPFPDNQFVEVGHPSWSSDGQSITFVALEQQDPDEDDTNNNCPALNVAPDVWSINVDGSNLHQITQADTFMNRDAEGAIINSAFDANAPDWSPVSDEIVFWSGQEACFGQVWKISTIGNGSERVQLTEQAIPAHNDDPAWSPDGTMILFSTDRRRRTELWVMNADGSGEHFITENSPGPMPADAAWQPVSP